MRRALYIGRFQIFHLGHVDVLQTIAAAADIDEIVIAVGSSQYDHRRKSPVATWAANPFTFEERREMIESSLASLAKPWSVHAVPDCHDWDRWYLHLRTELPAFQVLYTADPAERDYFAERGKEVRSFPRRFRFHAGSIREALARGDRGARAYLPAGTLAVLDRIDGERRLAEAVARDRAEPARPVGPAGPAGGAG